MRYRLAIILLGIGLVQGCATSGLKRPSAGQMPVANRFGSLTPKQQALIDTNCYDGMPLERREPMGTTELVVRRGYILEHSSADKIPLWVCESVSPEQLQGHVVRSNHFKADPDLKGAKAYPNDYAGSGFDRGHQAPAGNQTVDPELKDQTFYMSNMAPQRPSLNRGIWKQLEDKTRAWVFRYGHAYEWTGPVLCVPKAPVDCSRQTIGEHAVTVPVLFYKIILVRDEGTWKVIAFMLPNIDFKPPYHLESYITSIEIIEKATGIEFMPKLKSDRRSTLESTISVMWP